MIQVVSFVATIELASCLSIIDLTVLEKQKKERDHECVRALENIREENFSKLLTRDRLLRTIYPFTRCLDRQGDKVSQNKDSVSQTSTPNIQ